MNFILWGATGQGKVLHDIILSNKGKIVLFVDNNREIESPIHSIPIVHGEEEFSNWLEHKKDTFYGAAAIGGNLGSARLEIMNIFHKYEVATPSIIDSTAFIAPSAQISQGVQVLPKACVCAHAQIGKGTIINTSSIVEHDCVLDEGVHIAPGCTLCGCVNIGKNSFIGAGTIILPRINIGENVVIGAGALVTKDIPSNMTAFGSPICKIYPHS